VHELLQLKVIDIQARKESLEKNYYPNYKTDLSAYEMQEFKRT
jgi:hypothetical protein